MKKLVLLIAAAGAVFSLSAYNGKYLNGKAVSVHFTRDGGFSDCAGDASPWRGSLVLYTIQNSAVTRADTIHKKELGYAHYAAFNLAGTKIAFYRFGQAPNPAGGCLSVNGGRSYISVINPDGSGLTDLCELPATPARAENFPLDWPAGDWIYYTRPHDAAHTYNGDNGSTTIWRVNSVSKANERVCNLTDNGSGNEEICNSIRRFTLSVKGDCMALMYVAGGKAGCTADVINNHMNNAFPFPPPNCAVTGTSVGGAAGCNISLSPSGTIIGSYFAGSHDQLMLGTIRGGPGVDIPRGVWIDAPLYQLCPICIMDGLAGNLTMWTGEYVGNGAELIRWSANSDKWVMQKIGNYQSGHAGSNNSGSNQLLCNFVDEVAINISKNPRPPDNPPSGYVFRNNDAGDVWVSDPANNPNGDRYEDLQGRWNTVDGEVVGSYIEVTPQRIDAAVEKDAALANRTLQVSNIGTGALGTVASAVRYGPEGTDWLSAAISGAGDNPQITLQFQSSSLPVDTYHATLVVTATGTPDTAFVPVDLTVMDHRDPDNPPNAQQGLVYKYYEGAWYPPPDFGSLTPVETSTCASFGLPPVTRNDNSGLRFDGYIDIPVQGMYTFYVDADDAANLYIGSNLLVAANWLNPGAAPIALKAGKHPVRLDFSQTGGGISLSVRWECAKAGIGKQEIPASRLYHSPADASLASVRPAQLQKSPATMVLYTMQGKRVGILTNVNGMKNGLSRTAGGQVLLAVPEKPGDRKSRTMVIVR